MKSHSDLGPAVIAYGEGVPRPDSDPKLWEGSFSMGSGAEGQGNCIARFIVTVMGSDEADKPVLTAGLELHYELFR